MKRLILTIALFSIGILSCTNDSFDNSLSGSWTVYSFNDLTNGTSEFKTEENSWDKDINIRFDNTGSPKTISGTNITNQIFGELGFVGQNQFKVSNFGSTKVNQPRWADEFVVAILDQDLTFKIANDRLVIYYSNKTKSVTFKRD
jgi:hypothetical protein